MCPKQTYEGAKHAVLFLPLSPQFTPHLSIPFLSLLSKQTKSIMTLSSDELKHRTIIQQEEEKSPPTNSGTTDMNIGGRRQKKPATAKRGLRTLGFAISLPVVLTLLDIYFFGSNLQYATMKKSMLYPPLWALHLSFLGSAFLMGLSSWLVWADGGFHKFPYALALYLCQLGLGLAWDPIVFKAGASRVGLMMCVALFGTLAGCIRMFKRVNPIASDLVKPTLFWALLLTLTNIKLVHP